ncbi:MAG TPA: hypothetical protein VG325_03435 [Solirubrobacteraceae bacterium]|nr:hypothetical protein [Solirubrobacteraceae bacterium]
MHTTGLRSDAFQIMISGRRGTIAELFDGFDEHDRLGIVIADDDGAAGAAILILAIVTAFYDCLRAGGEPFFAYADYFAFHVGRRRGDLRKLDVWPDHKEVVVAPDAEAVTRAINDRGITRLLVPDGPARPPAIARETLASAHRRIVTALAYAADGRPAGADVTVGGTDGPLVFVEQMLQTTGAARAGRATGPTPGSNQGFRRIDIGAALAMLIPTPG